MLLKLFLLLVAVGFATAAKNPKCVFPFNYRGESYDDCAGLDGNSPWCSADQEYAGAFYYCNEREANSYESNGGFLQAQEKLLDNARMLTKIYVASQLDSCTKCDASMTATVNALTELRKIATDNERRLGWVIEKKGKDMEAFIESIQEELGELADCPDDMVERSDHCYSFGRTHGYSAAKDQCSKTGGSLVSIHDKNENDWIMQQVVARLGTSQDTYIGLNDVRAEGKFEWVDTSEVNFLNWNKGEPNAYPGENCAEMRTRSRSNNWNDILCSGSKNFVCKKHKLDF